MEVVGVCEDEAVECDRADETDDSMEDTAEERKGTAHA